MNMDRAIAERAQDTQNLDARIKSNRAVQSLDFTRWVMSQIPVKPGDRVLELCCGTGAQTVPMLDAVGPDGKVLAMDVSRAAVEGLAESLDARLRGRLDLEAADMDSLANLLEHKNVPRASFDRVVCAYGLYYSKDAVAVLDTCKEWLKPGGTLHVIGPHGENNSQIFRLLEDAGVDIPAFVRFTSQEFMFEVVIRWAARNASRLAMETVVNETAWASEKDVLDYWRNTTFYEKDRESHVRSALKEWFETHPAFTNEKHIMSLRMVPRD